MTPNDKLAKYLNEHYAYELQILRYARQKLGIVVGPEWNLTYEAYSIHARTLRDFYTNREPKDRTAAEYGVHLKNSKQVDAILRRVNKQVAHLDRKRPFGNQPRKLRRKRIDEIADWIERRHIQFIKRCVPGAKVGWIEPQVQVSSVQVPNSPTSSAYSQRVSFSSPTGPASPVYTIVTYSTGGEIAK